jgi:hypothetical protein
MTSGLRKFALTTHVTSSVGWLGAVGAFPNTTQWRQYVRKSTIMYLAVIGDVRRSSDREPPE